MELKNSQIHPSPKGRGFLWQEDKKVPILINFSILLDVNANKRVKLLCQ